jgi:DNA-binding transcriptional ArsR family regulator
MATATPVSCVPHVGEVAGVIWQTLKDNGPISVTKLVKAVDEPRDTVMLALGWLAREEKINIDDEGRNRIVSLRS